MTGLEIVLAIVAVVFLLLFLIARSVNGRLVARKQRLQKHIAMQKLKSEVMPMLEGLFNHLNHEQSTTKKHQKRVKREKALKKRKHLKDLESAKLKREQKHHAKLRQRVEKAKRAKLEKILRERLDIPEDSHYSLERLWEIARARNIDLSDVIEVPKNE